MRPVPLWPNVTAAQYERDRWGKSVEADALPDAKAILELQRVLDEALAALVYIRPAKEWP